MRIVRIQATHIVCASEGNQAVSNVSAGETGITYGGGGSGTARVKEKNVWDEEW